MQIEYLIGERLITLPDFRFFYLKTWENIILN